MATIRTSIMVNDGLTTAFKSMNKAMNLVINSFEKVQSASGKAIDVAELRAARQEINNAGAALEKMEEDINKVKNASNKTEKSFSGWQKSIIVANQAIGLIKSTLGSLGVFSMDKAFARIDTMSQFERTAGIMTGNQNAAKTALESLKSTTLGTAYGLDVAAKATQGFITRGMRIGKATDQVRVWADAISFYGKGTNDQLETAVDALGKMRTKGTVEMEQLNRLFDVGINAVQIYADAVGRSAADVQEDLTAKSISAAQFIDTVSEAMDKGLSSGAAKSAGQNWTTTFANVQAAVARGWVSAIEKMDRALVQNGFPKTMALIKQLGSALENMIGKLGSLAAAATKFVPVFLALGKSLAITGTVVALNAGVMILKKTMIDFGLTTKTATVAVNTLNLAMLKSPLFIAGAATAAIAGIIYAMDRYDAKLRETSDSIQVQTMSIRELSKAKRDIGKTYQDSYSQAEKNAAVSEKYIKVIQQLENASNRNAYEQKQLQSAVSGLNSIYPSLGLQIDSTTGKLNTNSAAIRDNIANLKNLAQAQALQNKLTSTYETMYEAEATVKAAEIKRNKAIENTAKAREAASNWMSKNSGVSLGPGYSPGTHILGDAEKEYSSALKTKYSLALEAADIENRLSKLNVGIDTNYTEPYLKEIAANTGSIADSIEITGEDLKYLRDIAERDAIDRFTTAEFKVEMTNTFGDVRETADVDGIIDRLATKIEEQMAVSAEGVYS